MIAAVKKQWGVLWAQWWAPAVGMLAVGMSILIAQRALAVDVAILGTPAGPINGVVTCSSAGTQFPSNLNVRSMVVVSNETNTGTAYLGGPGVSYTGAAQGIPLVMNSPPTGLSELRLSNSALLYCASANGAQQLNYLAVR